MTRLLEDKLAAFQLMSLPSPLSLFPSHVTPLSPFDHQSLGVAFLIPTRYLSFLLFSLQEACLVVGPEVVVTPSWGPNPAFLLPIFFLAMIDSLCMIAYFCPVAAVHPTGALPPVRSGAELCLPTALCRPTPQAGSLVIAT